MLAGGFSMPISHHVMLVNMNTDLEVRFWAKVDTAGDCWVWLAYVDPGGYGRFSVGGKSLYAHRVAFNGPIPDDKVVDHICCNRRCVRPTHLRLLTRAQNTSRGKKGKFLDTCRRGHDMTDPRNVRYTTRQSGPRKGETNRLCAECNRINASSQASSAKLFNRE